MLRLKTFGGLWLEGDEGPLTGAAAQRRRLVLLAALAAAGQKGMSRDALVGLLWPEVDEARARAALSQALPGWAPRVLDSGAASGAHRSGDPDAT